jgi:hypothetical protein
MGMRKTPSPLKRQGAWQRNPKEVPMHPDSTTVPFQDERFWAKVRVAENGCWLWTGAGDKYGVFSRDGQDYSTHRYAFTRAYGPTPPELLVCHTCDNPLCVRCDDEGRYELNGVLYPRRGHLWLGTYQANIDDMIAKGRRVYGAHYYGENNRAAKLTSSEVREIRARYAAGGITHHELGLEFAVSHSTIYQIVCRKTWRNLLD